MIKFCKIGLYFGSIALLGAVPAAPAFAQATRTWVSGVGDDANPCSRTAPCKTFAGAISKTAAGGEIDCLDPGGFGAVTITKSITIDCDGTFGSILAAGTNGVNINDSATGSPGSINVILRGISINGAGTGLIGINFTSGRSLVLDEVTIQNFNSGTAVGMNFRPTKAASLSMNNLIVAGNGTGATGGGIVIQPSGSTGSANVQLRNVVTVNNAGNGLRVDTTGDTNVVAGISVVIESSEFSNGANGINVVVPASTSAANVLVNGSTVSNNSGTGLAASGSANGAIRVSGSTITANGVGVSATGGASVGTFGDNRL
jgi:hypothetical protein